MATTSGKLDMDGLRQLGAALSNWGRWGPDDERGTLNLITPERTAAAASVVRRGVSFALSIPADDSGPWTDPATSGRFNPIHKMTRYRGDNHAGGSWGAFSSCEDMLILGTHSTTHLDALCHVWYDDHVYNGTHHDAAVSAWGAHRCSIEAARDGIVSRGILFDVPAHLGVDYLAPGTPVGPELLDDIASAAGIEPRPGDVLLLRTGTYPALRRGAAVPAGGSPGLSWQCARWLRDHDIALVCADNFAVEVVGDPDGLGCPLHMLALRDLGLGFGELFDFEGLAADCAADGVYECLFVAAPLNVPGGAGSPVNPLAVK